MDIEDRRNVESNKLYASKDLIAGTPVIHGESGNLGIVVRGDRRAGEEKTVAYMKDGQFTMEHPEHKVWRLAKAKVVLES